MKPNVAQNADERWAKSRQILPGSLVRHPLWEIPRKLSGWSSGLHPERGCQGSVRSAGRVAVALGSAWIVVALWVLPAHGWWRTIPGVGNTSDSANATIRDAVGDLITVGQISGKFAVRKFSGATGDEVWRQEIDGKLGGGAASAVAVDGSGDVIAAGYLRNRGSGWDFTVIEFSGATGEELWRQEIDGTESDDDEALAVAVDASGDVVAAGYLYNSGTTADFTVIKFSCLLV